MKIKKMYRPPAYEVVDKVTCDFCGKELVDERGIMFEQEIKVKSGEIDEYHGEYGDGVTEEIDICLKCWKEKLLPLLAEKFGVKPQVEKYSW